MSWNVTRDHDLCSHDTLSNTRNQKTFHDKCELIYCDKRYCTTGLIVGVSVLDEDDVVSLGSTMVANACNTNGNFTYIRYCTAAKTTDLLTRLLLLA